MNKIKSALISVSDKSNLKPLLKILKKKKYDIFISYSVEYSYNKVCAEYAKLKKIKIYLLI